MTTHQYQPVSYQLTKQLDKETKRNNGIYFTPPATVKKALDIIHPYMSNVIRVLEPSCGSGEFLHALSNRYSASNITIDAIENNTIIYNAVKDAVCANTTIYNQDYLGYVPSEDYDLIIGNPPFFVIKKQAIYSRFYPYFDGRPNIFLMFVIKSLGHLKENGLLCFVLPTSFLNCLYYDKTRKHINDHFAILNIEECRDDYIETKQETVLVVLQKRRGGNDNHDNVLTINNHTIFGTTGTICELRQLYDQSTTLAEIGFDVNVGSVVWNQCKAILTEDATKTQLIYSSDIANNTLSPKEYINPEKKNYIDKKGHTDPLLVINRGYGVGKYEFQYCLLDGKKEYLVENHLICVRYTRTVPRGHLVKLYEKIITSLQNDKTQRFIQLYFGNNAINTTELKHVLPIYM